MSHGTMPIVYCLALPTTFLHWYCPEDWRWFSPVHLHKYTIFLAADYSTHVPPKYSLHLLRGDIGAMNWDENQHISNCHVQAGKQPIQQETSLWSWWTNHTLSGNTSHNSNLWKDMIFLFSKNQQVICKVPCHSKGWRMYWFAMHFNEKQNSWFDIAQ